MCYIRGMIYIYIYISYYISYIVRFMTCRSFLTARSPFYICLHHQLYEQRLSCGVSFLTTGVLRSIRCSPSLPRTKHSSQINSVFSDQLEIALVVAVGEHDYFE